MSVNYATRLELFCDCLLVPIHIATLHGDCLVVDQVYRSCVVSIFGYDTWIDLIILGMVDFDLILGID